MQVCCAPLLLPCPPPPLSSLPQVLDPEQALTIAQGAMDVAKVCLGSSALPADMVGKVAAAEEAWRVSMRQLLAQRVLLDQMEASHATALRQLLQPAAVQQLQQEILDPEASWHSSSQGSAQVRSSCVCSTMQVCPGVSALLQAIAVWFARNAPAAHHDSVSRPPRPPPAIKRI